MASRFADSLQAGLLHRSLVVAIAAAAVIAAVVAAPVYGGSLPTLFEVDTLADSSAFDGHCSLREAVSSSNGNTSECGTGMSSTADSIHFTVDGTITLGSALSPVADDLTIDGSGHTVTLDGNDSHAAFTIKSGKTATISHLTFISLLGVIDNSGTTHLTSDVFEGNSNGGSDPAASNEAAGILTISHSVFRNNGWSGLDGAGAVYNGGTLSVTDSTFSGNRGQAGAAIFADGPLTVRRSAFVRNSATVAGAIESGNQGGTISNSTFFKNDAESGGAILVYGGNAPFVVINSTFAGNTAATGTAIDTEGLLHPMIVRNDLFSGVAGQPTCAGATDIADGGGNLSWPDTSCPGANVNPRLAARLGSNGGRTPTLALSWNSAAIDHGSATYCHAAPVNDMDQRIGARPVDGNHDGTKRCDSGSFEYGSIVPAAPTLRSAIKAHGNEVLTWNRARDAVRYVLRVSHNGSFVATRRTTTAVQVSVPLGAGHFSWTVGACDPKGCTTSSAGSFNR